MVNNLNNKSRNAPYRSNEDTGVYEISESYVAPGAGVATATERRMTLTISEVDQNKNHYLKTNSNGVIETVAYEFGDKEVNTDTLY